MVERSLALTSGTYLVNHHDLRSFLKKDDFSILHVDRRLQPNSGYLEFLRRNGYLEKGQFQKGGEYSFDHPVILHALVVLTNRCNMKCKYCYTEANEHLNDNEREVSGEEWNRIFDNIRISGSEIIQNISFTGGEPTCHPDFLSIFNHVSGKYKAEVSTNGLDLDEKHFRAFEDYKGLVGVNISIDSCYPEEDEVMRGEGTYQRRIDNLEKLCERGIQTCLGMVINGITVDSLADTTKHFLDKFPSLKIKYIPISSIGRARVLDPNILLSERHREKYVMGVLKMMGDYKERILTDPTSQRDSPLPSGFHWSGRCSHMKYESEKSMHKMETVGDILVTTERCNAAYGVVAISPTGRLRPCLRADSFYECLLEEEIREVIMPSIIGVSFAGIGRLPFWREVQKNKSGFNPLKTCALKYNFGGKNGC